MFGTVFLVMGFFAASSAHALTIQTVQFTTGSGGESVWGQSLTINVGATVADALIPAIVSLDFVGWHTGDPLIGSAD